MKKVILIVILTNIFILLTFNCTYVNGFNQDTSITQQAIDWITLGSEKGQEIRETRSNYGDTSYFSTLAGVLTGAGIWVSVISGAILGIRFMLASPDHKAELKRALYIWLIGTLVILGALVIWRTLISILDIY